MKRNSIAKVAGLVVSLGLASGLSGCRIHVDKGANGEDKTVQVDTPFGGVHVNTDQTTAADLGLPVYPGAQIVRDKDNDKSADVHLGFGEWELRVKVVNYTSADSQEKVTAFYKKALGRYGDVIACHDNTPAGTPTQTAEGLTCSDSADAHVNVDTADKSHGSHSGNGSFELKAGSKRHQHIVGFENPTSGETRFALVALDLPGETGKSDAKSD